MTNYVAELARLYAQQASIQSDAYLHAHSRNRAVIHRQVSIFERCQQYFKEARTMLDWGCRQAVDACLVRMLRGGEIEIDACDVDAAGYQVFFDFARLRYTELTHPYMLPYPDNSFDVVMGSGVIEHVPHDSASLQELYRVIRPGGHCVITMLPNKGSYTEFLNRTLGNAHHLRRYSLSQAKTMLLHHGFVPVRYGYHQVLPTLSSTQGGVFDRRSLNLLAEKVCGLNPFLERLWPINLVSTNIFVVGRKVAVMP